MINRLFLFLVLVFMQISCNKEVNEESIPIVQDLSETIQYKTLNNVAVNLLSLDIYYTSETGNLRPIVIYVHGGGWSIGDKSNNLDNKINLFKSLNYIFVSVNYRLSPFPFDINNIDRIKYPDHNNDVADAIKWVYENIDLYGGNRNKIALLGHSAGAHLVSLTGTNLSFLEDRSLPISAIKGVATIDTEGYDVTKKITEGDEMYTNAFGIDFNDAIEASPIYNIFNVKNYPKFFVAKRGTVSRINLANEFINKLELNGVQVTQVEGSIYTHEEINTTIGAENETLITVPLKQFFENCFK